MKNFPMPCPFCGEKNANIGVDLGSLETEPFHCFQCESNFSVEEVQTLLDRWSKVLKWVSQAPQP